MPTTKNIQSSDILDEIARGTSLDQSLNLIAQKATTDLKALTCKIWVVKHGDICQQCPLAEVCSNRQMCLHLASASGSLIEQEYPRIPISLLNTSLIVRGGVADFKDDNPASEKLFGVQQSEHPETANSYALYPLRGISGTVGLIGVFNNRLIDKSELQMLAQLAPAAVAAIRVAELQARCDSLRYQMEKGESPASQTPDKQVEETIAQLNQQITQVQDECDTLQQTREENQNRIAKLENENQRLREEIHSWSHAVREKIRHDGETDAQGELESDNLQEEFARFERLVTSYEQNIDELKREQEAIKNNLSARHEDMVNLKAELDASRGEFAQIQETIRQLEAQSALLEETNAELQAYNAALVEKVESLENSLRLAEGLCASIEQKRASLEGNLESLMSETEQLGVAHTQLGEQKQQLQEENLHLRDEVRRLRASNETLGEENSQLAQIKQQINEREHSAVAHFGALETENAELRETNAQLEDAVKQLEALVPKLEESVDHLSSRTELSERLCAEMEQRNRALTIENQQLATKAQGNVRLLANVSHELRSPINAILGFSSLILEDSALQLSEKQRHNLERIQSNSRDLSEFINSILDFSKIEAGHMDVYAEPVELEEVIERAIAVAEGLRGNRPIHIHAELKENLPRLRTDQTKLRQILVNLLSNAVKFTEAGEVKITASGISGDRVRIAVSDTGIGIAEADLPIIFEEFRQLKGTNRQAKTGTGLGLAITRRLVALLGGEIDVSSKAGEGSVFVVTLPLEIASSDRLTTEVDLQQFDPERTAVVVSHEAATSYLVRKYLSEAGYCVALADDLERGLEIVSRAKPALIIVDLDSLDTPANTIHEIASSKKKGRLITFSSNVNFERQALRTGADVFLPKPVDREDLLAALSDEKAPAAEFVLVVDDDADALEIVTSMLESKGHEVKTAPDGRAAMEVIARHKPAAIILDLMMPGMDGFEVAHRLQSNPKWRDIPVVLLTARDLSNEERAVLHFPGARILQKGNFSRQELIAEIEKVTAGNSEKRA